MIYTENTKKAINIAYKAHMGQEDKLGIPYIFNSDIGHVFPKMTIINGSTATVKCSNGKGSIEMELK